MDPKYKYGTRVPQGTLCFLYPSISLPPPCHTVDLVMFYELKSVLFNCLAQ